MARARHLKARKAAFTVVPQHKPHRRKLRLMRQRLGCQDSTSLQAVADGDIELHNPHHFKLSTSLACRDVKRSESVG